MLWNVVMCDVRLMVAPIVATVLHHEKLSEAEQEEDVEQHHQGQKQTGKGLHSQRCQSC